MIRCTLCVHLVHFPCSSHMVNFLDLVTFVVNNIITKDITTKETIQLILWTKCSTVLSVKGLKFQIQVNKTEHVTAAYAINDTKSL